MHLIQQLDSDYSSWTDTFSINNIIIAVVGLEYESSSSKI